MSEIKVNSIKGVGANVAAISINNANGTCTANITNNLSNRNKVINGGMMVHQRGDASATGSSAYLSCDRFFTSNGSAGQVAVTKSTDTPDGFGASTKWDCTTADTSIAAGDYFLIQHRIEGQNIQDFEKGDTSAKQFAVSFYIKATKTGVYTVELEDLDNNRGCSKTITVSNTNWNRYSIIFPADTTGAFDNDNALSLSLNFWLLAGSTFNSGTLQSSAWGTLTNANRVSSSNVNALDSTSNDFFLTGVQLEVGGVVTNFEHRSYAQELALCQRYCQVLGGNTSQELFMYATGNGTGTATGFYQAPVDFRTTPSFSISNLSHVNIYNFTNSGNLGSPSSMNLITAMSAKHWIYIDSPISNCTSGGGIMVRANSTTDARFILTAEL